MRLGLFGGSFDPVHLGHLELARQCQQQARLDEVWFLPAATQPLKKRGPVASEEDRVAMLDLAITGQASWTVNRIELDRGGMSYTVDTLREIHTREPDAELFFLMGADSLHDLSGWREPRTILELATPLVVARAGEPEPDFEALSSLCKPDRLDKISHAMARMPAMAISSTEIRDKISHGETIESMLPVPVAEYITSRGVYRREPLR